MAADNNIYTVLITAITVLGGTSAWRYYEKRALKQEHDDRWMENECKSRITKLEMLLAEAAEEKDALRATILNLTAEVAKLQTEVKYLMDKIKGSL